MANVNITPNERRADGCQDAKFGISGLKPQDAARFWANVDQSGACWLWTGHRLPEGYGQLSYGGVPAYAHRLSWQLHNGPIGAGLSVLHQCDTPACVNPAHLFLGTHTDNMRDASRKGRLSVARHRTRGVKPVAVARYLHGGITARALATEYGVSTMTVLRWVHQAVPDDLRTRRHRVGKAN